MANQNLYEVLGVSEDATEDEIKFAYKRLAKRFHPDVAETDKKEANEKFKKISAAYSILSNPRERSAYDQSLKYGGFQATPEIRYEWIYLVYLDAYGWFPRFSVEWNDHHQMMYR